MKALIAVGAVVAVLFVVAMVSLVHTSTREADVTEAFMAKAMR